MRRHVLLLFFTSLFFGSPLFALRLIEPLRQSNVGDYFLFSHKKNGALVVMRHISPQEIVFEEIHAPLNAKALGQLDVAAWLGKKAPGHTAWIEVRLSAASGAVLSAFCHMRNSALPKADQRFTTTLLSLLFQPTPMEDRRRCGVPNQENLLPRRLWEPPAPIGLQVSPAKAFVSHWPKDGSEIAGGRIEIYTQEGSSLPVWIEVRRANLKEHIRLIATGKLTVSSGLHSI